MTGISIVIITYNRCEELKITLTSLTKQKCKYPLEVVVLDQNSSDNTGNVCKNNYGYDLVYVKSEKNLGVAGGRDIGAKHAKYEYMIFLDDDAHFVSEVAVQEIYKYMHSSSYSIFAFQIRDLNNELFHWPYSDKKKKEVDNFFLCNKYIGCGHAIKKEFFDKVGGYTKDMFFGFEESELVMKSFAVDGLPVQYNGKIIIVHRVTQTTRLIESKRFYYKVRNRLFIIRELAPFGGGPYFLLYLVVYFVRSLQYRLVGAYFKGVKDAMGKKINKRMRMSVGAFIKYLKYGI